MIRSIFSMALAVAATGASAQSYVKPHIRSDGTFVQGHVRSAPNSTSLDNYSSKGNVNPYTGARGTVDPLAPNSSGLYRPPFMHQRSIGGLEPLPPTFPSRGWKGD